MKAQLPKAVIVFFAITITVLAFLSINNYFRGSTKDYAKWFLIGETVLKGWRYLRAERRRNIPIHLSSRVLLILHAVFPWTDERVGCA
jgi:hypothetical protein